MFSANAAFFLLIQIDIAKAAARLTLNTNGLCKMHP